MSQASVNEKVPQPVLSSSYVSAGLAVLLTVEILGIGIYAYNRVQTALKPENLADHIEVAIRDNYPEFRKDLVAQVKQEAPAIAKQVSAELIAAAPDARVELEELTERQLELGLETATELSAEQFQTFLQDNRPQIVKVFETIEDAPEDAHQLVLETEKNIEQQLGVDMQRQAKMALRVHRQVNDKLDRISESDENLKSKELLERRIVRLLRTMQQQRIEEMRLTMAPAPGG